MTDKYKLEQVGLNSCPRVNELIAKIYCKKEMAELLHKAMNNAYVLVAAKQELVASIAEAKAERDKRTKCLSGI